MLQDQLDPGEKWANKDPVDYKDSKENRVDLDFKDPLEDVETKDHEV